MGEDMRIAMDFDVWVGVRGFELQLGKRQGLEGYGIIQNTVQRRNSKHHIQILEDVCAYMISHVSGF